MSEIKESNNKVSHFDDDEEKAPQNPEGKNDGLKRKVEKVSVYDQEYIWELVHNQLLQDNFSQTSADYIMVHFDNRYQYALDHIKFARTPEAIAEYVYNGILTEWNTTVRKQKQESVS